MNTLKDFINANTVANDELLSTPVVDDNTNLPQ